MVQTLAGSSSKFAIGVAVSALFAAILLTPALALANAMGRLDSTSDPAINEGADCSDCHGNESLLGDPSFARLDGPGTVVAGDVVPLTLVVSNDSGNNRDSCGFGLSVTDGVLTAIEGQTEVRFSAGSGTSQLVHTGRLSSICTDIDFEWTAPSVSSPTNVTFYAGTARTFVGGPRANDFAENASLTLTVLPELPQLRELLAFGSVVVEATDGVSDMGNPMDVVVSPDGNNVYVAADSEDAVVTFDRDSDTGALDNPRVIKDTSSGGSADGLRGPIAVVVDSPREQVYVATDTDNQVVTASRDAQGAFSFVDDRNPTVRSHTDAVLFPDGQVLAISGDDQSGDGVDLMDFDASGREGLPTTFQTRRAGTAVSAPATSPLSQQRWRSARIRDSFMSAAVVRAASSFWNATHPLFRCRSSVAPKTIWRESKPLARLTRSLCRPTASTSMRSAIPVTRSWCSRATTVRVNSHSCRPLNTMRSAPPV